MHGELPVQVPTQQDIGRIQVGLLMRCRPKVVEG